jgi:hypothetical protein
MQINVVTGAGGSIGAASSASAQERIMRTVSDQSPFAMQPVPVLTSGPKLFYAGAQLQAYLFKAAMRYQIEALAFLKHRCEQDVRLIDDLVDDGEFNDAFDVFSSFFQKATAEYAAEAGKVASINSKLASETAKRVRKEAESAIEDMAAQSVA